MELRLRFVMTDKDLQPNPLVTDRSRCKPVSRDYLLLALLVIVEL